jgi:hypothetical protein
LDCEQQLYQLGGKSNLSAFGLSYHLTNYKISSPWLKNYDSMSLEFEMHNLAAAFEKFFKNGGYPKFKSKKEPIQSFRTRINGNNIKLFEIGCGAEFASFNMWKEYFPKGQIFCMDINEEIETDRGVVYRGDQTNIEDLQRMVNLIGECEIIIDDGSHIPQHQIDTFNFLFENMLKNGGVYIIEDIECNYWNPKTYLYGYEVGSSNIVDHLQSLPHRINSEFSNFKNHKLISSVTFFKNCIILTKMTSEEIEENKGEYRFKEML